MQKRDKIAGRVNYLLIVSLVLNFLIKKKVNARIKPTIVPIMVKFISVPVVIPFARKVPLTATEIKTITKPIHSKVLFLINLINLITLSNTNYNIIQLT